MVHDSALKFLLLQNVNPRRLPVAAQRALGASSKEIRRIKALMETAKGRAELLKELER